MKKVPCDNPAGIRFTEVHSRSQGFSRKRLLLPEESSANTVSGKLCQKLNLIPIRRIGNSGNSFSLECNWCAATQQNFPQNQVSLKMLRIACNKFVACCRLWDQFLTQYFERCDKNGSCTNILSSKVLIGTIPIPDWSCSSTADDVMPWTFAAEQFLSVWAKRESLAQQLSYMSGIFISIFPKGQSKQEERRILLASKGDILATSISKISPEHCWHRWPMVKCLELLNNLQTRTAMPR